MFHIIEVLRVAVEKVCLLLSDNYRRDMLAEKSDRIAGPGIAVHAHFDRGVESWDIRQQRKAFPSIERFRVPGICGKRRFEIEQIGIGARKIGVDDPGRKDINHRGREIERYNALVYFAEQGHHSTVVAAPDFGDPFIETVQVVIGINSQDAVRHNHQKTGEGELVLNEGGVENGPGGEVRCPRPEILMVGGTGLDSGIRHAERFYSPVDHAVEVDLAHVAVMGVNDPVCVVNTFYSVKSPDFGLYRNSLVNWSNAPGFTVKVGIQLVAADIFLGLPETESHAGPQADILAAGPLLDHVPDRLKH